MFTQLRSVNVSARNLVGALAFSREVCEYMKSKVGIDTKIAMPFGGNPNRIFFITDYESLAACEQVWRKLLADPKYMELMVKTSDHFVVGSASDEFWQTP